MTSGGTGGWTGGEGGPPATTSPRGLLVGLAAGTPVMAYGVWGALGEAGRVHPPELARWIVGAAVVHDLVVVPLVLAVAWAARRVVPRHAWPAVRSGLVVSGTLSLVAWPFVRGYGSSADNPSLLPRDYTSGLLAALAVVWAVVAVAVLAAHRRQRRTTSAGGAERPAQDTPTRSTTKTSVSSGPMTPPAPREP